MAKALAWQKNHVGTVYRIERITLPGTYLETTTTYKKALVPFGTSAFSSGSAINQSFLPRILLVDSSTVLPELHESAVLFGRQHTAPLTLS